MRYNRVLVKLSGAAIAGERDAVFDPDSLNHIADEVLKLHNNSIEVGIVVGGGNIFRGGVGQQWGIERAEADNIGMMATVANSLMLRGVLTAKSQTDVRVMTAIPMSTVAEPFIRLRAVRHLELGRIIIMGAGIGQPFVTTDYPSVQRAIEIRADAILAAKNGTDGVYTADPRTDPTAERFETVNYDTVIRENLQAMDQSSILLARDHQMPVHVFNFDTPGVMLKICQGQDLGTLVHGGPDAVHSREPVHH